MPIIVELLLQVVELCFVYALRQVDGVQPNHQVMGTLIGHAVRDHSYEYLTSLIRMMMHQEMTPNDTILQKKQGGADY